MNPFKTSLAVASILGAFTQIGANDDVDAQLNAIKNAAPSKRQVMIDKLQADIKQMRLQERERVLQKVKEEMPEIADKIRNQSIAQKIKEIKNASPMQRKELMNSFKKELAQMKREERADAISQMRKEMTRNQQAEQKKPDIDQMNQLQKIERIEKRNQREGADQFHQRVIDTGSQPGPQGFGPN